MRRRARKPADTPTLRRSVRGARIVRGVLAASAGAASLLPAAAQADEQVFGGGLFVGYRFGATSSVEWGLEAFATHVTSGAGCTTEARIGYGPLLQLGLAGLHRPRLTLAMHGGGEIPRNTAALTGELGASYRFGERSGFGIHLGVVPQTFVLNAALRYQMLLDEAWLGGGIRVLPTYGEMTMCESIPGRPLRSDEGVARLGAPIAIADAPPPVASPRARVPAVGQAFARDAQAEYASVPAFLQLAAELAHHAAPASLVQSALAAAHDELLHAQMCARLASRHLGQAVAPALPELVQRQALPGLPGMLRLGIESWLDGCIVEGVSAAHAGRAAQLATDAEASAAQHRIAADEQRHAELAWAIVRFCIERGGDDVRHALHALQHSELAPEGTDADTRLQAHGRLDAGTRAEVAAAHLESCRARLAQMLG